MNILFLYTEPMGYTKACIEKLVAFGHSVHLVYWDKKRKTPYEIGCADNLTLYPRSKMSSKLISSLAARLKPSITVVSGWQDRGYLSACYGLRKSGRLVVAGFDDQWHNTPRQRIGSAIASLGALNVFFSHAWVAGPRQYEYARRFGFEHNKIVFDVYSADTKRFEDAYALSREEKRRRYPRELLFVGRLEAVKGLEDLLVAWKSIPTSKNHWVLRLIGAGSLSNRFQGLANVTVQDFLQPELLANEVAKSGCLVLPSRREAWGVVVHEATAAGLPLILSDEVGAGSVFLIPGLNGYRFAGMDRQGLTKCILRINELTDEQLFSMAEVSRILSSRITTETCARNLLSVLEK